MMKKKHHTYPHQQPKTGLLWPETIEYCPPSLRRCQHLRQESSPKSSLDVLRDWWIGGFIGNSGLQLDILNIVSKSTSSYSEIAMIGDSPT